MYRKTMKFSWIALVALLLILGGCKGESPTAPPPGGTTPPGGTPPPAGVTITVTASNNDPLVDSTVVLTATVTDGGVPVPNGTAVEFSTNNGTFTDTSASTTVRTTTNGVATATLTSSVAGASRTTVVVNNVSRTIDVTFRARPVTTPPATTVPSITSVTPSIGRPAGGETIRITGRNFTGPVRVLFDVGGATPVEGFVVNRTDTTIDVITPAVNLGAGQELVSRIIVITAAGSTTEQRAEVAAGFTFRNQQLTPAITTLTPNSGPVLGGTRVSILGEGFQAPVQVMFGFAGVPAWQEAQVVEARFNEIVVIAPEARSTAPGGSGVITGPVDVRVVNIASATETVALNAFRYIAAMQITALSPGEGSFTGGTRVTIDGVGFVAPVAVSLAGVAAQVIDVSGTRIIAIASPVVVAACAAPAGVVAVTNISNGDTALGPPFIYRVEEPFISNIQPSAVLPGGSVTVTVANASPTGGNRIQIGTTTVFATPVFNPDGSATFTVTVPNNIQFATEACTIGATAGTRQLPTTFNVTYTNVVTGCTDSVANAITVNPCAAPPCPCNLPPPPDIEQTIPTPGGCADAGTISVTDPATGTATIVFTNVGGQPLQVTRIPNGGTNPGDFVVTPNFVTIAPGATGSFTVTFNPSAVGPRQALARFTTNDPDEGTLGAPLEVCISGTGQ